MGKRLSGKIAIVTGGASGIGAETCRLFAAEGSKGVVIADINEKLGRKVAEQIRKQGGDAVYVFLDVSVEQQWIDTVATTVDRYGQLDITVNNAGVTGAESRKTVEDTTLDVWQRIHSVNLDGVFLGTKYSIPAMRKAGGGSIINISSVMGIVGSTSGTSYHSAKGAVRTLTKATAIQYAHDNIRSNSIHPGFVDTAMTADMHAQEEERTRRINQTPLGRLGTPEDIASGCVYLASDESSFVTGVELLIDGGMLAQ